MVSDTKEMIDAGFAQLLDAINADDPKQELFVRAADLRKESAAALSQLRTQVEGLEARCADYEADLAEGRQAARNFGVEIDDDDDEPKWWIAAVVVANRASPSLQDERERAAREEERERCANEETIARALCRQLVLRNVAYERQARHDAAFIERAVEAGWQNHIEEARAVAAAIRQERGDKT